MFVCVQVRVSELVGWLVGLEILPKQPHKHSVPQSNVVTWIKGQAGIQQGFN